MDDFEEDAADGGRVEVAELAAVFVAVVEDAEFRYVSSSSGAKSWRASRSS
ncbi:hypothetical protein ACFY1L_05705 [Streptomyces sp. NPDC001663]|uniref:hypothetical protein n=1 Tax=Streptomyces sp. NPDC001663 TaxID=3364597 RepID=UPI0036BC1E02